jgi:hypothetical protein
VGQSEPRSSKASLARQEDTEEYKKELEELYKRRVLAKYARTYEEVKENLPLCDYVYETRSQVV